MFETEISKILYFNDAHLPLKVSVGDVALDLRADGAVVSAEGIIVQIPHSFHVVEHERDRLYAYWEKIARLSYNEREIGDEYLINNDLTALGLNCWTCSTCGQMSKDIEICQSGWRLTIQRHVSEAYLSKGVFSLRFLGVVAWSISDEGDAIHCVFCNKKDFLAKVLILK